MTPPSNFFFALSFFTVFVSRLSAIFLLFKENSWEHHIFCSDWNISLKNFVPTSTYSGLCNSDHRCMAIQFLLGFLGLGVIYSENNFGVRRSLPKITEIISASLNLFERRYAHIQGYVALSERQNCSHSIWKLARDHKIGPMESSIRSTHWNTLHFWTFINENSQTHSRI